MAHASIWHIYYTLYTNFTRWSGDQIPQYFNNSLIAISSTIPEADFHIRHSITVSVTIIITYIKYGIDICHICRICRIMIIMLLHMHRLSLPSYNELSFAQRRRSNGKCSLESLYTCIQRYI